MKKRVFFLLFLVIAAFLFWLFWPSKTGSGLNHDLSQRRQAASPSMIETHGKGGLAAPVAPGVSNTAADIARLAETRQRKMEEDREAALEEWRTPIEFYGKVVDENTNVVGGAEVYFDCNDTSAEGTSFYHTNTGQDGMFSISGIKGRGLNVKVSKDGYYSFAPSGLYFNYAGEAQNFLPDAANPIVFHLKRKGVAARLIRFTKGFDTARDGAPTEVQLATAQAVPVGEGDIRVQCWTHDEGRKPGQHYDWKCQITIPGGGLVLRTDSLDFQAPANGYQPSDVIDMPADSNAWTWDVKRNYFVRLADGNYGRVSIEIVAGGEHFFRLESFLNPSGSPNLEYNPQNYVHAGD